MEYRDSAAAQGLLYLQGKDKRMELDDHLKQLLKQLGMAINESLSDSDSVGRAIANIREAGYDVFLVLEATIGFQPRAKSSTSISSTPGEQYRQHEAGELVLTPKDTEFLRSLKITLVEGAE